jgi:hypothetical protein
MKNKGGETMFSDASLVITFGNVTNSGTSKIKATKDGKDVEFAKRTKAACDKNHITGMQTKGTIIATVHGFILEAEVNDYKKQHSKEWSAILGGDDFDITETEMMEENPNDIVVDAE